MPDGILIIDKPSGWTSMDVCAKLRGIYHERRIGHGGTLDPMATGVLPVFIGRATRAVEFAERGEKVYEALLRPGIVTDTQDTAGTVLEQHPAAVNRSQLERVLSNFTGEIQQIPPMYSAVKIHGKKLYELARKGREIERPARTITIHALELLDGPTPQGDWPLRVRCSKGTYIRTLCHDIGQALGCGAVMAGLRRTMACGYALQDASTLEQVLAADDPCRLLRTVDTLFADRPALTLSEKEERRVRNGVPIPAADTLLSGEYRLYAQNGEFLALSRVQGTMLRTIKSFFKVETQVN